MTTASGKIGSVLQNHNEEWFRMMRDGTPAYHSHCDKL
jgi:hypothetical protein